MAISSSIADVHAALLRAALGRSGPATPDETTWDQWLVAAQRERLVPLLYVLVDTVPTDLSEGQRDALYFTQRAAMLRCVRLEHRLLAVVGLFAEHGIRCAVLKGGATAHLDYPDPSWREVGDIDVLIEPEDRVRALELLAAEGWMPGSVLPRGHEQHTHDVTLNLDVTELDLHQRVAPRALGLRVPTRELLDRAVPFDIAGTTLLALNEIDRLIHSTIHAVTSRGPGRRLSSFADVLLEAHRYEHRAPEVLARADGWRVRSIVERGVLDAYAAARLEVPPAWTEAMRRPIRRRDRLVDRAYLAPNRQPVFEELAYLRLLPGWRSRWQYVRGYLTTTPAYEERYGRSGMLAQTKYLISKLRS